MVLQMPVFVALFNILYMTIDLRQAPFFGWITDLSAQDPYYVLPIIMGVTMIIQQKIMPTTMDPTQAKIMLLLPAFMTLLFLSFPAGLVLYWLTNNIVTITQQFVTDRYIFKKRLMPSSEALPTLSKLLRSSPRKRKIRRNSRPNSPFRQISINPTHEPSHGRCHLCDRHAMRRRRYRHYPHQRRQSH